MKYIREQSHFIFILSGGKWKYLKKKNWKIKPILKLNFFFYLIDCLGVFPFGVWIEDLNRANADGVNALGDVIWLAGFEE